MKNIEEIISKELLEMFSKDYLQERFGTKYKKFKSH
jgi:hypothetical protein